MHCSVRDALLVVLPVPPSFRLKQHIHSPPLCDVRPLICLRVCRLTIQNFWSDETRLPPGTLDRMVAMLEAMYSPGTEAQYLSYATSLLLEMTSKSPDYNKDVFERPLSECKFQVNTAL